MTAAAKVVKNIHLEGKRGRDRSKKKWFVVVERNTKLTDVCEKDPKDKEDPEGEDKYG